MIHSCCFVSQSNYLNNSNKDCDWLNLVLYQKQCTADATFIRVENKVWFESSAECVWKFGFFITKQIKKPVLFCSVVLST